MTANDAAGEKPKGKDDPEDIAVWPDGEWCFRDELGDYGWKSDDYEIVAFGTPRWHDVTET